MYTVGRTAHIYIYLYIEKISIDFTSVGLASARPNNDVYSVDQYVATCTCMYMHEHTCYNPCSCCMTEFSTLYYGRGGSRGGLGGCNPPKSF